MIPTRSAKFCDHTKPVPERVADIVSRLTTTEKIGLLDTIGNGTVESLDIPVYNWWSEATHV